MQATELVKWLQSNIDKYGDSPVLLYAFRGKSRPKRLYFNLHSVGQEDNAPLRGEGRTKAITIGIRDIDDWWSDHAINSRKTH